MQSETRPVSSRNTQRISKRTLPLISIMQTAHEGKNYHDYNAHHARMTKVGELMMDEE